MFFKGSRYANLPTATYKDASGRVINYVRTRFITTPTSYIGHKVIDGERMDLISYQYLRDPEQFWRICDVNLAMWPDEIVVPGDTIAIPPASS